MHASLVILAYTAKPSLVHILNLGERPIKWLGSTMACSAAHFFTLIHVIIGRLEERIVVIE